MTVFGAVAQAYDDVRPGYPASIAATLGEYLTSRPPLIVEIGAGTGTATAMFRLLGAPMLCVEPDPRMGGLLRAKFPDVTVECSDFAAWTPPVDGVPVLAGAMMWHWLEPGERSGLAHAALAPGGVLAIVGRGYRFADAAQGEAASAVLDRAWPTPWERADDWIYADVAASGLFADVAVTRHDTVATLSTADYCRLVSTFSPFQLLPLDRRGDVLAELGDALAATGDVVGVAMATTLTLARRPHPGS